MSGSSISSTTIRTFCESLARLLEAGSLRHDQPSASANRRRWTVVLRSSEGRRAARRADASPGGFAVLEVFRKQGIRLPVVVMTVHGDVAMAVRATQAGGSDSVEKPFDDAPLLAMIEML